MKYEKKGRVIIHMVIPLETGRICNDLATIVSNSTIRFGMNSLSWICKYSYIPVFIIYLN